MVRLGTHYGLAGADGRAAFLRDVVADVVAVRSRRGGPDLSTLLEVDSSVGMMRLFTGYEVHHHVPVVPRVGSSSLSGVRVQQFLREFGDPKEIVNMRRVFLHRAAEVTPMDTGGSADGGHDSASSDSSSDGSAGGERRHLRLKRVHWYGWQTHAISRLTAGAGMRRATGCCCVRGPCTTRRSCRPDATPS
jgi:hypothetical protein